MTSSPSILWLLIFLVFTPLPAQEAPQESLAKKLHRLEQEVKRLSLARKHDHQRIQELLKRTRDLDEQKLAMLLQKAVRNSAPGLHKAAREPLSLGGYFDLEFRDDQAGRQKSTFSQSRLVLQLDAEVSPHIAFASEIEFEGGGAGAEFLTDNEISVEFAELRFSLWRWLNLKAGALLVPFNRFNKLHDAPLQELTDRPLVDRRIVPTTWTEVGIGATGAVNPAPWMTVDYDVVLVNGLTDRISATSGTRLARSSFREDNNDNKMLIGRLGVLLDTPFLDNLGLGASLATGKYDPRGRRNITMVGLDWNLKKGPFELLGEYAQAHLGRGTEQVEAGIPGGLDGWYTELRFHFFPESWRGATPFFTKQSSFTLVARFGQVDTDSGGTAVDFPERGDRFRDDRRRLTLGLNFRPTARTVLKFEYQWIFEPASLPDVDNNRFVASFATYF